MANLAKSQAELMATLSAVQTILERYGGAGIGAMNNLKTLVNGGSIGFMLDILKMIGVTNDDLSQWIAKILTGSKDDGTGGFLDVMEKVIKNSLLLNLKNMLSCQVNPFISDDLMDTYKVNGTELTASGRGVDIDIKAIDLLATLSMCPSSKSKDGTQIGKARYFDVGNYPPNQLWKSRDFNAFLWFIINKGEANKPTERFKLSWDSRNSINSNKWLLKRDDFFSAFTEAEIEAYNQINAPKKKKIINCRYEEQPKFDSSLPNPYLYNKINVTVCSETYYKKRKTIKNLYINKTIHEFNYDYINSLKLFDSKVMLRSILDRLFGNSLFINTNVSFNERILLGKVDEIIRKVISADDTEINNCFFSFSNKEYNQILQNATIGESGAFVYTTDETKGLELNNDGIDNQLNEIEEVSTLQERKTRIGNLINDISATTASDDEVEVTQKFGIESNIITQLLYNLTYNTIYSILSPKVLILLAINQKMMASDASGIIDISKLLEDLMNVIVSIVIEIKNVLIRELFNFLMEQLRPILELFINKMLLEQIKIYKEILESLFNAITQGWDGGADGQTRIDKVNYADIIPTEKTPTTSIC